MVSNTMILPPRSGFVREKVPQTLGNYPKPLLLPKWAVNRNGLTPKKVVVGGATPENSHLFTPVIVSCDRGVLFDWGGGCDVYGFGFC